jgi:hypothetical protein
MVLEKITMKNISENEFKHMKEKFPYTTKQVKLKTEITYYTEEGEYIKELRVEKCNHIINDNWFSHKTYKCFYKPSL